MRRDVIGALISWGVKNNTTPRREAAMEACCYVLGPRVLTRISFGKESEEMLGMAPHPENIT